MTATPRGSGATSRILARLRPQREKLPRDILVMLAAAFLIALGFGLVAPVLPQFATTFGVGNTEAAVIVAIFAFMRLAFAPAGGYLIGRFGERPVYVAGLLIVALSTAACAFAQSYWQLLLFRGFGGAGSVMFTVASMALVIRLAPPRSRGRVSGAYASAFLIGNVCGPIVGGLLAGLGLRVPFLAYAAALIVAALVVQTQLSHERRGADGAQKRGPVMRFGEALATGTYRSALLSSFANGWATFGVRMATVPLFAAAAFGAGPQAAGLALAVFAAGNAAALSFSGRLADSLGRKPMMISGLLVAGLATAAIGATHDLPWFLAASTLAGVGSGLFGPAQQAAVADVIGSERSGGKVLAVYQMTSDVGAIVGPVVAGLLADRLGFGWAFGATGGIMVVAAAGWLATREPLRNASS
ncbi:MULTISPECIES: MFS transporter [unclassified Arthrobacter]|uniref:MFS transporter n=1 Tax=unclassified Arthrobacter TaxID=235627 RepID=UPI001C8450F6|nr:MFS transporter [Arthrobacter sp. MAHUQ-56]MBX7445637.1 MFS transporter [Arthrobacter sp. MAHUQ-56]